MLEVTSVANVTSKAANSLWQPDDLCHSCEALQPRLNVGLAEAGVAVGVQQALLSGQQRPASSNETAVVENCNFAAAQLTV
jgi:hypothetical protein